MMFELSVGIIGGFVFGFLFGEFMYKKYLVEKAKTSWNNSICLFGKWHNIYRDGERK